MIEIIPVGGYSEIGRNCTIVKWNDESVMLDFGLRMENYIRLTEDEEVPFKIPQAKLIREDAVPDIESIKDELKYIKAICVSHAHLDHVGAIPFFTNKLKASIHGTKFTIEVLKALLRDKKASAYSELIAHPENSKFKVSKNLKVEFIHVTHSTPHTVIIVVHTPDGCVVYANDFKLDNAPVLGKKPNYEAMQALTNVRALIMDSLYAPDPRKTPSESIAREMLRDVLLGTSSNGKNIIITTFSGHIARLKTIVELAQTLKRKPVFIGRSLSKYVDAAKAAEIIDFEQKADFVRYGSELEKYFKKNQNTIDKLFIVTGHQGEPKAVMSRISKGKFFPFNEEDLVIFSCKIIPVEENFHNRDILEAALKLKKVRIFADIHVSGHACREDHREFIKLIKPENVIPTHGDLTMLGAQKELCKEIGYNEKNIHILANFQRIYV